jgi:hypothetical protein
MELNYWHDQLRVSGRFRIRVHDHETNTDQVFYTHNLVTDSGLNVIAGLIARQPKVTGITHLAVGTGGTPPANTDTALETEIYRKEITRTGLGIVGTAEIDIYLQRAVAITTQANPLREIGLFAGDELFARALLPAPIPKSSKHDLLISYWSNVAPEVIA